MRKLSLANRGRFRSSDMKRLLELARKRTRFTTCLRGPTFGLLFTLAALVMAKTPPLDARKIGVDKTQTMPRAGPTALQGTHVTTVPPFTGDHSETWEEFGVNLIKNGTSILGGIATISGNGDMLTERRFQMCSVFGQPSDGIILM